MPNMVSEGSQFPEFSLQDQTGKTVTLNDLKGQKSIVYFYPKDDTSGEHWKPASSVMNSLKSPAQRSSASAPIQ
jgi:peroxiredoxin